MTTTPMPELPLPFYFITMAADSSVIHTQYYTADQVQAYAIAATEQGKRQPLPFLKERAQLAQEWCELRALTAASKRQPPYPEGDVVGPCVCGSWPGGKCLKCPWISTTAQRQPPAGYQLVPIEPTPEMIEAGCPCGEVIDHFDMRATYRAMLSAATEQGKRQPLTEAQIDTVLDTINLGWWDVSEGATEAFARAVEAAHGITATPQGKI